MAPQLSDLRVEAMSKPTALGWLLLGCIGLLCFVLALLIIREASLWLR